MTVEVDIDVRLLKSEIRKTHASGHAGPLPAAPRGPRTRASPSSRSVSERQT